MPHAKEVRLEVVERGFILKYHVKPPSDMVSTFHDVPSVFKEEVYRFDEGQDALDRMLELSGVAERGDPSQPIFNAEED